MANSALLDRIQRFMDGPLSVLALWQPWAILCVAPDPENNGEPAKRHETRHWRPKSQSLPFNVAIHAAKRFDGTVRSALEEARFREALKRGGMFVGDPRPFLARGLLPPGGGTPLALGCIIGLATVDVILTPQPVSIEDGLAGVQPLDLSSLSADDRAFGYYQPQAEDRHQTRYAWRLANAVMLPQPIPHSGRQEPLYQVDALTRDEINRQLRWMEMAA